MKPRVSVILCTYNGARYLEEQLDSLVQQDRRPDELIVGDDGSTDGTLAILEVFAARSPFSVRLKVNGQRLGSTENFGRAVTRATGDLVLLCDQDDVWHPSKVRTLVDALEADPGLGGCFCDARLVDEQLRPLGRLWDSSRVGFTPKRRQAMAEGDGFRVLLDRPAVTGACFAFRNPLPAGILPIPPEWVHDAWISLMLAAVSRLQPVDEPLIDYRQHSGAQIGAVRRRRDPLRTRLARVSATFEATARRLELAADRLVTLAGVPPAVRELARTRANHARHRAGLPRRRLARISPVAHAVADGRYAESGQRWTDALWDLVRPSRGRGGP
ncbi:MAG TPA: glycosyltransferase family 2 protein [Candidatus Thermoplasmatota archaeon]|nr:glycosyltransferase family 2 protein [Candidatus Thermoplasmatota archaeon]